MKAFTTAFALFALVALAACALVGPQATPVEIAGIVGGSGAAPTLGGVPLDLSGASVTVDGEPGSGSALQPGVEMLAIGVRSDRGFELSDVEIESRLKGPIDVVDGAGGTFDAVGVRVMVDGLTVVVDRLADGSYLAITLGDLDPGDHVEVYGVPRVDDAVLSTRVVRKIEDRPDRVDLRLPIRDLDSGTETFSYGLLSHRVDYSGAEVRGALANGVMARFRGFLSGTTIDADRVRTDDDSDRPRDGNIELEGPVVDLDEAAATFTLLGFTVDYAGARVEGSLVEGAQVEVEGNLTAERQVEALKVEIHHSDRGHGSADGRQQGPIEEIDTDAMTLTVAGASFWADGSTKIERDDMHIPFSQLQAGDWVELEFDSRRTDADDRAYATKIENENETDDAPTPGGETELEGVISNFDGDARTFTLGQTPVTVVAGTEYEDDAADVDLEAATFWGQDRNGARVKVEGTLADGGLSAREIKLR